MPTLSPKALVAVILVGALTASVAAAQDTMPIDPDDYLDAKDHDAFDPDTAFQKHDVDMSGDLNLDEFTAYVVDLASHGDESARALVVSGDYEAYFTQLDTDSNEGLSANEVIAGEHYETDSAMEMMEDRVEKPYLW